MKYTSILTLIALVLNGCAMGPKYVPPTVSVPSTWNHKLTSQHVKKDEAWWRNFQDPLLNELIEQNAVYNLDLKMAQARVNIARAQYAVAVAQLIPHAGLGASPPTGTGFDINQLIALTGNVDPDIFGKNRQLKQMAKANVQAEQADLEFALINLYSEIASSYLELREAQARNNLLAHNILSNKTTLDFIKSRYKAGYSNQLDMSQQDGLIETQAAELEQNKAVITTLLHKIELLTGNNPGVLAPKLLPPKPVPQITRTIHLGVPAELLRRRPDIRAAERRVAAAHANIRVAMSNLLPQITIGWLLGWQTQTIAGSILTARNLFTVQNPESTFYGTFTAPLFNVGLFNSIELRKREKIIAVVQYQIAVMRALHEVETQFEYLQNYKNSFHHLKRAVEQKHLVLKLARDAYHKSSTDFSTVLRAEEELNRIEFAYLQNRVRIQITQINLYKALGGNIIASG
ncbi:multidrug efflux MFS outer membrane protein [Legionella wadsworthii]|uniref:Multidrug efflux MFS outer membrane protein n=1 Tax=Legionella wadsworthii TaxID=28088 RepID=A0A378LY05_9GAMM|nr:efflux transporter outer membrane subunit [Legionella wadsworthii]STY28941.1 multidrug efflux MFS outer membrane protein [Legionella wadsworthii]